MNKISFYNTKKSKVLRLHDKFYIKENRYKNTKESFKELIKVLKKNIKNNKVYNVLDIGCANGELIYNLSSNFKNFSLTGMDVRKDLLKKAIKNCSKDVIFFQHDIKKKITSKKKYDLIICAGVLSIFDDLGKILHNIKQALSKDGEIFLFGNFNTYPYNVNVKYKDLIKNKDVIQSGWNIWSIKSIKDFFYDYKIKLFKFNIKKKIKPHRSDPIRSWTININKKKYFLNGLSILQNQFWIRIYK